MLQLLENLRLVRIPRHGCRLSTSFIACPARFFFLPPPSTGWIGRAAPGSAGQHPQLSASVRCPSMTSMIWMNEYSNDWQPGRGGQGGGHCDLAVNGSASVRPRSAAGAWNVPMHSIAFPVGREPSINSNAGPPPNMPCRVRRTRVYACLNTYVLWTCMHSARPHGHPIARCHWAGRAML